MERLRRAASVGEVRASGVATGMGRLSATAGKNRAASGFGDEGGGAMVRDGSGGCRAASGRLFPRSRSEGSGGGERGGASGGLVPDPDWIGRGERHGGSAGGWVRV